MATTLVNSILSVLLPGLNRTTTRIILSPPEVTHCRVINYINCSPGGDLRLHNFHLLMTMEESFNCGSKPDGYISRLTKVLQLLLMLTIEQLCSPNLNKKLLI